MTKSERADYVLGKLIKLYPETPIPLDHHDPFTLLVAVLLSAQCTDKRVNIVTPGLFSKADTPELMVRLAVEEIREIIRPCGLSPRKARAISELSAIILKDHGGEVPRTFEELEALPGVGHKTASVVMAQAFGAKGMVIERPEEADSIMAKAMSADVPVIVEARTSLENVDAKNTISELRAE